MSEYKPVRASEFPKNPSIEATVSQLQAEVSMLRSKVAELEKKNNAEDISTDTKKLCESIVTQLYIRPSKNGEVFVL